MKLVINEEIPHITKYMGSKRNIISFVVDSINKVYKENRTVVDLFAGSSIISGALRNQTRIHSNDIQEYSSFLAGLYLNSYNWKALNGVREDVLEKINITANAFLQRNNLAFDYSKAKTLKQFTTIEKRQSNLIKNDFSHQDYHLFTKFYSGTYWNYNQCVWIDAIRKVADDYKGKSIYYVILGSLMYAMTYNSQSTGHYAQYRDALNEGSVDDIIIYRKREILPYFLKKFDELKALLNGNKFDFKITTLDYKACLADIETRSIVYADPPYCFVHYSRFYHALETLVKYDYPEVQFKGRYRTDRHQSPFCIHSQVKGAFIDLFKGIKGKKADLVLSYSNTGMVTLQELKDLMKKELPSYKIDANIISYQHSTMGRKDDKSREVEESTLIAKYQT